MAFATLALVGDRLYAINATITGIHATRYFPQSFEDAKLPLILALPGQATYRIPESGSGIFHEDRVWTHILWFGALLMGMPGQSAQTLAETYLESVIDAYVTRPKLELAGAALDGVMLARLQTDTGIAPDNENGLVTARISHLITTRKTFAFNTG